MLLRDLAARVDSHAERSDEKHREVLAELKESQKAVGTRLAAVEIKVDKHQHYFSTMFSAGKYLLPSGGVAALLAWLFSVTNGQAK
jgi:hypothetical protein